MNTTEEQRHKDITEFAAKIASKVYKKLHHQHGAAWAIEDSVRDSITHAMKKEGWVKPSVEKKIEQGAIFRHKENGTVEKLWAESDGEGGNFGLEYWRVESVERPFSIGASPFTMDRDSIEKSPLWERVK